MVYNIDFDIAALFVNAVLILLAFFRRTAPKRGNLVFRAMLLCNFLATSFDIASAYFVSYPDKCPLEINYIIAIMYYLFHNCSAFLFVQYGLLADKERAGNKKKKVFFGALFAAVAVLVLTTPFTKLVFYFDAGFEYCRGPLQPVLYAIALANVVYILYLKLTNQESQSTFQIVSNIAYVAALFTAFAVHIKYDRLLTELFAVNLGYLVMYISLDNPEQYLYKTIAVYNRLAFDDYMRYKTGKSKPFQILIVNLRESEYYRHLPERRKFAMEKAVIRALCDKGRKNHFFVLSEFCYAIVCQDHEDEMARAESILKGGVEIGERKHIMETAYAVVRYPEVANTCSDLFTILDDLLYRIINQVGSKPLEADPSVLLAEEKKKYENLMMKAVKNDEFCVEYEPVFDTRNLDALNAEARLMIKNGSGSIPMNTKMFRIADEDGLIIDIDEIMLRLVGEFIEDTKVQKLGIGNIIVNLSITELMNIGFTGRLEKMVEKYKLPCGNICFKIIDLDLSVNGEVITRNMKAIHALGFKFVVDNFGEGPVTLSSLIDLPIAGIKLGERITKESVTDEKKRTILSGLVRIIKELGFSVACGDIATALEGDLVKNIGADYAQGGLYSRPMEGEAFIRFVRAQLGSILTLIHKT